MEKDVRMDVITDKFNKLEFVRIDFHKSVFLSRESRTYGIYIDNQMESLSINPYYFMFNYIGIDEDRWDFVDYYGNYIIDLVKEKTFLTFDVNHAYMFVTYNKNYINNLYDMILDSLFRMKT